MRKSLVAGNWKMNCNAADGEALVSAIKVGLKSSVADVVLCPPFVYLPMVKRVLRGSPVSLGAQNMSQHVEGAYTGELSAGMLLDVGCKYVILGHSERRAQCGESDAIVAEKVVAASKAGLTPILCIGELLAEREQGTTEVVISCQLDALLSSEAGLAALQSAVIAYEPVWAIGTGMTATPEQAQSVHAFIRQRIAMKDPALAARIQLLYGGSVKGGNAEELFAQVDIDGGLIGGASLDAEEFLTICRAAT